MKNKPTAIPYLDLVRENLTVKAEMQAAFDKVITAGSYVLANEVAAFEQEFAAYCDTPFTRGVASGLDALSLILEAMAIGEGDEVIVPANSFVATALAVSRTGARPVLCDIHEATYNLDPAQLPSHITPKTKAVIITHLYGQPCDMDTIGHITRSHGLALIEDAAQAHGATYKGRKCGGLGDAAAFSFYPTKNLGAVGDGGAVTSADEALITKISLLRNYGSQRKYYHEELGHNSRLDELQAALLRIKLKHLADWLAIRREIAQRYLTGIKNPLIRLPHVASFADHAWHVFVVRVTNRPHFLTYLTENEVGYNIHYPVPIHRQQCYTHLAYGDNAFPVTEKISEQIVSIPLHPFLTDEEINRIIKVLNHYNG